MDHTYLRYECADSFGLVTSVGAATSSRTPVTDNTLQLCNKNTVLTTAGSHVTGFSLSSGLPTMKLAHADFTGIGTGQALNNGQVICLDVSTGSRDELTKIATGWNDGQVRVFDHDPYDATRRVAFSIIAADDNDDMPHERPDPLTLNGHAPHPVTSVKFDAAASGNSSRLASGGSDGSVIVWDLVAESGLFRLLGHHGAITQLHFIASSSENDIMSGSQHDLLLSSSLDGLIKVWDLAAQASIQTLASLRGDIWASSLLQLTGNRLRFMAGSLDGQVRVWNVDLKTGTALENQNDDKDMKDANSASSSSSSANDDDICKDMGYLASPLQHLATSSSKRDTAAVTSKERVLSIRYNDNHKYVGVLQANAKLLHIYSARSIQETRHKQQRRIKRKQQKHDKAQLDEETGSKKKKKKRGILDDDDDDGDEDEEEEKDNDKQDASHESQWDELRATDEFEYCGAIKASHKIKAFVFLPVDAKKSKTATNKLKTKTLVKVACALSTNTLELYSLQEERSGTAAVQRSSQKETNLTPLYGHPTGVRSICLSTNDELAATISKGTCKVWNVARRSCLQSTTLEAPTNLSSNAHGNTTFQGLCAVFLPGNAHVVVGTKEGHIVIIDIAASEIVYWEEKAHDDAIWSMDLYSTQATGVHEDGTPMVQTHLMTGSADKKVQFWTLQRQGEQNNDDDSDSDDEEPLFVGAPMIVPTRILEMTDEVVSVKYSYSKFNAKNRRLVFVSTLDCTIKVFFEDSLKLFLSLYGHKLPALAVDASDDDTLLVSGSADKTIKLWGLDFGDTHKTLHGHEDSVTCVEFVKGTHNFFSASKDSTVRYWDGDRFVCVQVLRGHAAEIPCLAVSAKNHGAIVLSGGMDRQVRVWERTRDIVFLEEEQERELEQMFDNDPNNRRDEGGTASILARKNKSNTAEGDDDDMHDEEPQSEAAVKQNLMSISAGDRLLEGLELADQELQAKRSRSGKGGTTNPMLLGMEPPQYVLWILKSIKAADLEQSLLVLPLSHVERLLYYLVLLLKAGPASAELCSRVAVFTIKTHQNQLLLNQSTMAPLLRELRRLVQTRLQEVRDTVGYTLAACRMIGRIARDHQQSKYMAIDEPTTNVWAGLGLGSDVAAALEGNNKKKSKR